MLFGSPWGYFLCVPHSPIKSIRPADEAGFFMFGCSILSGVIHIVPLPKQAVELLRELQALAGAGRTHRPRNEGECLNWILRSNAEASRILRPPVNQ